VLFLPASPPPGASQRGTGTAVADLDIVMLLPGTRLDAAWNVAERVRRRTAAVSIVLGPDAPRLGTSGCAWRRSVESPLGSPRR
jgi:hypothetical protein